MREGRELLQVLKANARAQQPCLSIPIGVPVEAVLRPVATVAGELNDNDVRVLTEWRNRFVQSFLTEFEATQSRTAEWLTNVVGPDPTRILFMLDDMHGQTLGYLGLAFIDWEQRTGEADSIVRGANAVPGLMTKALLTLIRWAHEHLGLTTLTVRVRSDNSALHFYSKIAAETRRVPLRRVEEPGMTSWIEDTSLVGSSTELVYLTFHPHLYLAKTSIGTS
jgi:RimJ/RimL family protein N-acetyltransferase